MPVAADPAVTTQAGGEVVQRHVVEELDVGDEARAGEEPFEEVVREHGAVGDAGPEHRIEDLEVVEPLANEGSLGEEVLVHVGDRAGVRVEALLVGEDLREAAAAR